MKKIAIIYGQLRTGLQKKAVEVLSSFLQEYTQCYPVCFAYSSGEDYSRYRCIYIGTEQNNPYIAEKSEVQLTQRELTFRVFYHTIKK